MTLKKILPKWYHCEESQFIFRLVKFLVRALFCFYLFSFLVSGLLWLMECKVGNRAGAGWVGVPRPYPRGNLPTYSSRKRVPAMTHSLRQSESEPAREFLAPSSYYHCLVVPEMSEFAQEANQGMYLEDLVKELQNNNFSIQQKKFRIQKDSLRFATKTRAEIQCLSDQLAQIVDTVRRLEESQLELHHLEITEAPYHG